MRMSRFLKAYGSQVLSVLAIVSLIGAGVIGHLPDESDTPDGPSDGGGTVIDVNKRYLSNAFPTAASFELLNQITNTKSYLYRALDDNSEIEGYVTIARGDGYLGYMKVVVAWSPEGVITNISVPEQSEEVDYFSELYNQKFFDQYIGRSYTEPLILGKDIDAASGATYSSNGVAYGVRNGRDMLAKYLASI
mgnify:CR=1 FL=1